MSDLYSNMTSVAAVDHSIVTLESQQQFLVAAGENMSMEEFATIKVDINAKSISIPLYSRMTAVSSALTDKEEVTPVALADSQILIQPLEYGNVIVKTAYASAQTAGIVDLAAAKLVGINAAQSMNKLACLALDASTNLKRVNDRGNDAAIVAGDVVSGAVLDQVYNKLARASVPAIGGYYVLVLHEDCLYDLREESSSQWVDVSKYQNSMAVLNNEIGIFKGFRCIRNNYCSIDTNTGSGSTVEVYHSYALGLNGLAKVVSRPVELVAKPAGDLLDRFYAVGWKGIFAYGIADTDSVWMLKSSSSRATNV